MHGAAPHAHTTAAATEMSAATSTTEMSTATSTTEVTAAPTAAEMSTTAPAAASGISNSCQTKRKAYCGRTCRNFPHDTTS
jgi:hypothetical protein